jgi:hypothetical protein
MMSRHEFAHFIRRHAALGAKNYLGQFKSFVKFVKIQITLACYLGKVEQYPPFLFVAPAFKFCVEKKIENLIVGFVACLVLA